MATEIPASVIKVNPTEINFRHYKPNSKYAVLHNPRRTFDLQEARSLYEQIRTQGLMQEPGIFIDPETKSYELLWGERRVRTILLLLEKNDKCKIFGTNIWLPAKEVYDTIKVKCVPYTPDILELVSYTVSENLNHSPVPEWEMMIYIQNLESQVDANGNRLFTREQLCKKFQKSNSWISQTLSLMSLDAAAQVAFKNGTLSRTAALQLLAAKEEKVSEVLVRSEQISKDSKDKDLEEAIEEEKKLEQEVLDSQIKLEKVKSCPTANQFQQVRQANLQHQKARKHLSVAQQRTKKIKARPVEHTAESINLAIEQTPDARQEDKKAKAWTPKVIGQKLAEMQEALKSSNKSVIVYKDYELNKKDLLFAIALYKQILGGSGTNVLQTIHEFKK